jgi:hypothetical protein
MQRFILIRLFQNIIALIILSILIFFVVRVSGDPALLMLPEGATQQQYQEMRALLGLDKPIYVQYGIFFYNAMKGDFGRSIRTKKSVFDSIKEALPNSIKLVAVSMFMAFLISIPLGVMAAAKRDVDRYGGKSDRWTGPIPPDLLGRVDVDPDLCHLSQTSSLFRDGDLEALPHASFLSCHLHGCRRRAVAPVKHAGISGERIY